MRKVCHNCVHHMGCEYYAQCFFDNNKPNFNPSDTAILMDVVKRNADSLKVAATEEEIRVLEDLKNKEI